MNIRNAIKDDAACIARIQIEAWRSAYDGIMQITYLNSLSMTMRTKQWHEVLVNNGIGINLVIEHNNIVTGFCIYGPARDKDLSGLYAGELVALNILPSYWGMGLGSRLVKHVIKLAGSNGWESLYLWVIKENIRARKFYESMGFEIEGGERINSKLTGCKLHEIRYVKQLG